MILVCLCVVNVSPVISSSADDLRNKVLFEKLYSQNKRLWSFISQAQNNESKSLPELRDPVALPVQPFVSNSTSFDVESSPNESSEQLSSSVPVSPTKIADYLVTDPADHDLDQTSSYGRSLRIKGASSNESAGDILEPQDNSRGKSKYTDTEMNTPSSGHESAFNNSSSVITNQDQNASKPAGPNALQSAWNSVMHAVSTIGQPKTLSKRATRRNFKVWSFQIGLRNIVNNDSDGFKHDAEIYHQLGYRLNDKQKIFVEHKNVTLTGDGFGKISRTGLGYQHHLKSVNEESRFYPYFAFFYDHWMGNFESFRGVPVVEGKDSKAVFTTRLGVEFPLTDTTNLDVYWERGKKALHFVDAMGTKVELQSRSNLYGMGLSHSF